MNNTNGQGNGKGGVPTDETRIVACQCGSVKFDVKKRTRTSISLVCAKCGLRSSVKGNVATVRVRQQEIKYAMENTVVTPDDTPPEDAGEGSKPGDKPGDGSGPVGEQYVTRKVRMLRSQAEVWDRVMEKIRIMNCKDDKFREQTWQGHGAEFMAADCESGMPKEVNVIYDAMQQSVADAERIANEDGKKPPTPRKIRDIKAKVRDKLAVECGILPPDFLGADNDPRQMNLLNGDGKDETDGDTALVCPECNTEVDDGDAQCKSCGVAFSTGDDDEQDGEEEDEKKEFKPIQDDGKLMAAVVETLRQYAENAQEQGIVIAEIPVFDVVAGPNPSDEMVQAWTEKGGYIIRVFGDVRTINDAGQRPTATALVSAEPAGLALDFSIEYDDQTEELGNGVVEVVELLPPDYDVVGPWEMPHFADRREQL